MLNLCFKVGREKEHLRITSGEPLLAAPPMECQSVDHEEKTIDHIIASKCCTGGR